MVEAKHHPTARLPAIVMAIDFGPALGCKTTSAQLTENYQPESLIGSQVVAVINLPPKRVAGVKSEVLVLGALCPARGTILLRPDGCMPNGAPVACAQDNDDKVAPVA